MSQPQPSFLVSEDALVHELLWISSVDQLTNTKVGNSKVADQFLWIPDILKYISKVGQQTTLGLFRRDL